MVYGIANYLLKFSMLFSPHIALAFVIHPWTTYRGLVTFSVTVEKMSFIT